MTNTVTKTVNAPSALSVKQILGKILNVKATGGKFIASVQDVAFDVTEHAYKHGDVTLASRLVDALDGDKRKARLIRFLEKHGPFNWNAKLKAFKHKTRANAPTSDALYEAMGMETWAGVKAPEKKKASKVMPRRLLQNIIEKLGDEVEYATLKDQLKAIVNTLGT